MMKMASATKTVAKTAKVPEPEPEWESDAEENIATAAVAVEAKRTRTPAKVLMKTVDLLPEDGASGRNQMAGLLADIREATEAGDIEFGTDNAPKWTAVKEYGDPTAARTAIRDLFKDGKDTKDPKPHAKGFEFTDRKFPSAAANGSRISVLYARYVGE
jgi:hypothetical protein